MDDLAKVLPAFQWLAEEWNDEARWDDLRSGFVDRLRMEGIDEQGVLATWLLETAGGMSSDDARRWLIDDGGSVEYHLGTLLAERPPDPEAEDTDEAAAADGDAADPADSPEDHWDSEEAAVDEASEVTSGVVDDIVGPALEQLVAQVPEAAGIPHEELMELLAQTVAERVAGVGVG